MMIILSPLRTDGAVYVRNTSLQASAGLDLLPVRALGRV